MRRQAATYMYSYIYDAYVYIYIQRAGSSRRTRQICAGKRRLVCICVCVCACVCVCVYCIHILIYTASFKSMWWSLCPQNRGDWQLLYCFTTTLLLYYNLLTAVRAAAWGSTVPTPSCPPALLLLHCLLATDSCACALAYLPPDLLLYCFTTVLLLLLCFTTSYW
jgi:hypothetical protein